MNDIDIMKGKVAVITASSTGIGKAIAIRLAKDGVKVVISSRKQKNVDETVKEIKEMGLQAIGIPCHVGNKKERLNLIAKTIQIYSKIDYLVCNAAVSTQMGNFLQASEEQVSKMWDINYKSVFGLIQQTLPHLRKQPQSNILIIASYAAYDLPSLIGHYSITKTALVALTKILAKELIDEGIRVNCIAPGLIKTNFSQSLWAQGEKEAAEGMGVRRLGESIDIAHVARFALSPEASYLTGETIVVAGKPSSRL